MSMRDTIAALESLDRRASIAAAELADERIDAERVSWLGTLLADYERLYKLIEADSEYKDDPDPEATAMMLREMWGMHRGLRKVHGEPEAPAAPDDRDWPL